MPPRNPQPWKCRTTWTGRSVATVSGITTTAMLSGDSLVILASALVLTFSFHVLVALSQRLLVYVDWNPPLTPNLSPCTSRRVIALAATFFTPAAEV